MKKILGLTVALIAVIAMLGTGTWAYFNDVVVVEDNTITAGSLYLNESATAPISLSGTQITPGTVATTYTDANWPIVVRNEGTLNGDLTISIDNFFDYENAYHNIEAKSGDTTSGANFGELGSKVKIAVWIDVTDTNDTFVPNTDYQLTSGGVALKDASALAYDYVDNFDGDSWTHVLNATTTWGSLKVNYQFPDNTTEFYLSKLAVTAGGTGYSVGDVLTLSNGATATVTAVNAGAITKISVTTGAAYTSGAALTTVSSLPAGGNDDATFTGVDQFNTDNVAQTDSCVFDLTFILEQQ